MSPLYYKIMLDINYKLCLISYSDIKLSLSETFIRNIMREIYLLTAQIQKNGTHKYVSFFKKG